VVVDDIDMLITHVIRGDDHVNNTPRQINMFKALGKEPPVYAHLPTVLNEQGEKMSKRNGAKAVTQYREEGYLPDAMVNYLARLGWSHGDDEIFSREQFVGWFNLDHLGRSAAQFDEAKLRWVNAQHMKAASDEMLSAMVQVHLQQRGVTTDERLPALCGLFKDRCDTTVMLADWIVKFYTDVTPDDAELAQHVTDTIRPALHLLADKLATCAWDKASVAAVLKEVLTTQNLKMPQLAMPVRVLVLGTAQTPSLDAVLALSQREKILQALRKA
jgi:glutamyl-tRNA synthetase